MKVIKFLGGLGNQMFQYSLYKAMQKRFSGVKADLQCFNNYTLHNGYELERIFGIRVNQISRFASNLYRTHNRQWHYRKIRRLLDLKQIYQEEKMIFAFDQSILKDPTSRYYWGYWQNFKYFEDIEEELRTDFSFKMTLDLKNLNMLNQISNTNSISLHIRRGDYLTETLLWGLCDLEYYAKAIEYIKLHVIQPKFYVFSDDIQWCRDNLNIDCCEFVSWNKGSSSYIDMQLMSKCKHNVIANSSFSYWGAWLNNNPDKIVIGPKKWINHIDPEVTMSLPDTWIKV